MVPVYREETNIEPFLSRTLPILEKIGPYEVIFCLDPSPDRTEEVIARFVEKNANIRLLVFSRRFGQPAAVMAGLRQSQGDACVVIDVDLQDPPEVILDLHRKMGEGYDVVTARRRSREGETFLKRFISWLGYKVIHAATDVKIPRDTGDFRIMSRRVVQEVARLKEGHGFLRGLVAFVGFRQTYVEYDRHARSHGTGNYNRYLGSLRIGMNGLVGFSNFLLDLTLLVGLLACGISLLIGLYFLFAKLVLSQPFPLGVPTIIILVLFVGGVQILSIGVLGQYIGRIYDEVRERPAYIIDRGGSSEVRQAQCDAVPPRERITTHDV